MRCETCEGTGDAPALIETPGGLMPCPYLGTVCPDCNGTGQITPTAVGEDDVEAVTVAICCSTRCKYYPHCNARHVRADAEKAIRTLQSRGWHKGGMG